jgi:polar amino acid transport system substrate-binding protein
MLIKMKLPHTMACLLVMLAARAHALTASDYCAGPVRVGLFEYGVLYRSATDDGIDIGVLRELEKRTGCTIERVVRPRARIWKELEAGTLDVTTAAVVTPERSAYLYFVPYMQTRNVLIVRKDEAGNKLTQSAFEAGNLRLGTVRSFRYEAAYEGMVAKLSQQGRVVEATDVSDLIRMLERKVVDAVLSQPIVFTQYLSAAKLKRDFVVHDWAPADQSSVGSLALSRKSFTAEQARHWDALMVSLQRDGTLNKIVRQFLGAAESQEVIYTGRRFLE